MEEQQIMDYILSGRQDVLASIDRLTILADDAGNFEKVINNNEFGFIERQAIAQHPYKRNFYCVDGSLLQWTDLKNFKDVRYEFNPNNVKKAKENEHMRSIAAILGTLKYPKVSRMDVAFDFIGYDFSKYKIVDKLSRKKNYWVGGLGELETLYIGSPKADLRIRIYDKRKEQKIKAPINWWRVELQFRDSGCMGLHGLMKVGDSIISCAPHIMNLLDTIQIFKPNLNDLDIKEKAMIKLILDEPETLGQLSKATRAKYKKILSGLRPEQGIDLEEIFMLHHDKLLHSAKYYLQFAERNDFMSNVKPHSKRSQEELADDPIDYENYTEEDGKFLIESAKAHMLYNG